MESKELEKEKTETFTKSQIDIFIIINIVVLALITYASTTLTLGFFGSIGDGTVQTSNWLTGLVNDACKIFLPLIVGIAIVKKKYFLATFIVFVIVGTMGVSYMASQGLDLNNSNKVLVESSSKQELVTERDKKETELKNLLDEKTNLILGFQSEITKLPINYPTAKKELQNQKIDAIDRYTKLTSPVQGQIDTYNNKIQNYKVDVSMTTSGYHAIAKYTGMSVGDIAKYKNIFMEVLSLLLSLCLGMLLSNRSTGIFDKVTDKISNFRKNRKNPIISNNKPIGDTVSAMANDTWDTIDNLEIGTNSFEAGEVNGTQSEGNRKIGFAVDRLVQPSKSLETCIYTRADIHEYLKYMYNNIKANNQSAGQGAFKTNTYLSMKQIKGIRYQLEKLKIVRIDHTANRTYILIPSLIEASKLI